MDVYTTGYLTEEKKCGHLPGIFASIRQKNWLKVNVGSTTSCPKQTRQDKNGATPPHQNPTNSVCMHLQEN